MKTRLRRVLAGLATLAGVVGMALASGAAVNMK
jgi:hypothetical protein